MSKFSFKLFIAVFFLNHCIADENNTTAFNNQQVCTHKTEFMNSIMFPLDLLEVVGLGMLAWDLGIAVTEKGSLDKSVIISIIKKLLKGSSLKRDETLFAQILCISAIGCGIINGFIASYEFNMPAIPCLCISGIGAISGLIVGLPMAYLSRIKFNLPLV